MFVTTPANYPILPPTYRDSTGYDWAPDTHERDILVAHHLRDHSAHYDNLSAELALYVFGLRMGVCLIMPSERDQRPTPADRLAAGIMYYRMRSGHEAFQGSPAWLGEHPSTGRGGSVCPTFPRTCR